MGLAWGGGGLQRWNGVFHLLIMFLCSVLTHSLAAFPKICRLDLDGRNSDLGEQSVINLRPPPPPNFFPLSLRTANTDCPRRLFCSVTSDYLRPRLSTALIINHHTAIPGCGVGGRGGHKIWKRSTQRYCCNSFPPSVQRVWKS